MKIEIGDKETVITCSGRELSELREFMMANGVGHGESRKTARNFLSAFEEARKKAMSE